MDYRCMQAAYQSLVQSGQFNAYQSAAIARAIEEAILQMALLITPLSHNHPELETQLKAVRELQETQKSSD